MDNQLMRITEEEAKKRVCPLSRDEYGSWKHCLGSGCMAWRWVGKGEGPDADKGFCGMSPHFPSR